MAKDPAKVAARKKKRKDRRAVAVSSTPSKERAAARKEIRSKARHKARETGKPRGEFAWAKGREYQGAKKDLVDKRQAIRQSPQADRSQARADFRANERTPLRQRAKQEGKDRRAARREELLRRNPPVPGGGPGGRVHQDVRSQDEAPGWAGDGSAGRGRNNDYVHGGPVNVPTGPIMQEPGGGVSPGGYGAPITINTGDQGRADAPAPAPAPAAVPNQMPDGMYGAPSQLPAQNIAQAVQQGIQQASANPASPINVQDPTAMPVGDPRPYVHQQPQANPLVQAQNNPPQVAPAPVAPIVPVAPPQPSVQDMGAGVPVNHSLPPQFQAIQQMNARMRGDMYGGQFRR